MDEEEMEKEEGGKDWQYTLCSNPAILFYLYFPKTICKFLPTINFNAHFLHCTKLSSILSNCIFEFIVLFYIKLRGRMPLIAPPPKPGGRTRVYRVIAEFQPSQPDQLELAVDDLVYLREAGPGEGGLCQLKRAGDGRIGLFPREAVTAHLEPIEFPLQEAAKMGDWDFLRECLENKVSVNSLDKSGSTALHWAAYTGHAEIVANLLAIPNIAISAQNKLGDSPLHAASAKGRLDCAELLVEAGANVHAKNGQGKRALDVAAQPEIGALLRTTMAARAANRAEEEDYLEGDEEEEETGS